MRAKKQTPPIIKALASTAASIVTGFIDISAFLFL
jgi:hypothetical protein